jgi:hypothetical protein
MKTTITPNWRRLVPALYPDHTPSTPKRFVRQRENVECA